MTDELLDLVTDGTAPQGESPAPEIAPVPAAPRCGEEKAKGDVPKDAPKDARPEDVLDRKAKHRAEALKRLASARAKAAENRAARLQAIAEGRLPPEAIVQMRELSPPPDVKSMTLEELRDLFLRECFAMLREPPMWRSLRRLLLYGPFRDRKAAFEMMLNAVLPASAPIEGGASGRVQINILNRIPRPPLPTPAGSTAVELVGPAKP
jgi:hypothetical protein